MATKLTFVTGNANKVRELRAILPDHIDIECEVLDLPELQGDIEHVAREKARTAAAMLQRTVLVEDTALVFDAFGGALPGPYIKDFVRHLGVAGVPKMLSGFESKGAVAICTFAICQWPSTEVVLLQGRTKGGICETPRGASGFGWDPIFEPEMCSQT